MEVFKGLPYEEKAERILNLLEKGKITKVQRDNKDKIENIMRKLYEKGDTVGSKSNY